MKPLFGKIAIIGIGLIGSSLSRAVKARGLADLVATFDANPDHGKEAAVLGAVDIACDSLEEAVKDADLVVLATPVGAYEQLARDMAPFLKKGAIISDVGSVKTAVIAKVLPHLPADVVLVPGHPVAGTEYSGPGAGFPSLFEGRWCILTPLPGTDEESVEKVAEMWRQVGSAIEYMDPEKHDRVLAITSHLPHLIAYTIVGTATDLEESLQQEVVKFSASGFRDFTRIAASDPVMWRDIFLDNRDAVLDVIQRFNEDLTGLQRAIRWGEGDKLMELFARTRAIRRSIIDAKQA